MNKKPTYALRKSVEAYLLARAMAETLREKVDKIERRILESANYYAAPELASRRKIPETIKDPKYAYLLRDDEHVDYLLDVKAELVKAGFEIESIPGESEHHYYCPALVAEDLQRKAEQVMIDAMAEMLEYKEEDFHHRLLCLGLEKYRKFIDLTCKFVVNSPGFKNPFHS